MNVLALDLATRFGWASRINGHLASGVIDLSVKRGESPGMRYVKFNAWLNANVLSPDGYTHPDLVVYEQAHHRGGAATEVAVGLVTRVHEWCALHRADHAPVHSASLKKWTTGDGRADKAKMIQYANAWEHRFSRNPITDDNEADAVCLLHYALKNIVGEP